VLALDAHQVVERQVGYEDSVLCAKFGFAPGSEPHSLCMLDLSELRRNDRELRARTALP
jgi:hypothetical protein